MGRALAIPIAERAETPVMGFASLNPSYSSRLIGHRLKQRLVLVHDIELDRARRLVGEILVPMDGAARDVGAVADLERAWLLALDGQGDFALLDGGPLVAGMPVEIVAFFWRNSDGLQPHEARRIVLERRSVINLHIGIGRRRL